MAVRTTRVHIEAAEDPSPNARLTQFTLDTAENPSPNLRLSQFYLDIAQPFTAAARLTHLYIDVGYIGRRPGINPFLGSTERCVPGARGAH